MAGLIAVLRSAETLRRNISSTQVVFVIDIEGFNEKSRHSLDLIVKDEQVGITGGVSCLTCPDDVCLTTADGSPLEEVCFCCPKPACMGIHDAVTVLHHDSVKREACVRPIEVAEQALIAEHQILPTGFETQTLYAGKITNQHVAGSHSKCADRPPARIRRGPTGVDRRVSVVPGASGADRRSITTPGARINEFEVKI